MKSGRNSHVETVYYASRFDFRFNNKYQITNARVDEKGERIKTVN